MVARIYLRVSTVEQATDDRTSLKTQEEKCRGAAMMNGIGPSAIVVYRDPGVSGSIPLEQRPDGRRMVLDCRPGDIVIGAKLDRLFRSCKDSLSMVESFAERGIRLIACDISASPLNDDSSGRFFFAVLAAAAEFERARITERVRDGVRAKKQRGGCVTGRPPFGYMKIGSGKESRLEPIPEQQEVIRIAREMKTKGMSLRGISYALMALGFTGCGGKQFHCQSIKRMVEYQHGQPQERDRVSHAGSLDGERQVESAKPTGCV